MTISSDAGEIPARPWKIFISHSARVKNDEPTPVAGLILQALRAKLEPRFKPLVDESLPIGKDWNPQLRLWLAQCHAAIVLLDEKAFGSEWVMREVIILAQRRAVDPKLFLLPVIINLKGENLKNTLFEDLLPVQMLKFPKVSPDDDSDIVDEIMKIVDERCSGAPDGISDAMYKWIRDLAAQLPIEGERLEDAARKLGCGPAGVALAAAGGRKFLAGQFLNVTGSDSELDKVTGAIEELTRGMTPGQRSYLAKYLPPVWVGDERPCLLLPHPDRHEEGRLVLLPAANTRTAEHYISRVLCCSPSVRKQVVAQASGTPTGEQTAAEVLVDVQTAVQDLMRNQGNSRVRPRPNRLYFLIIPLGAVTAQIEAIKWVHREYPQVNILKLTDAEGVPAWAGAKISSPGKVIQLGMLDADAENRALQWVDELVHDVLEVGST